jgi:hypothetical protein
VFVELLVVVDLFCRSSRKNRKTSRIMKQTNDKAGKARRHYS